MGTFAWLLFVYVFGGLTFIPLVIGLVLLHAYYTFPTVSESAETPNDDPADIKRADDEKATLKTATDSLEEQFHRKHESDVAAGYFAVCREYVPGGVNGKPPDKLSPAGEVVATESPSVYQSMYRSIFDRSQKPTIDPSKDSNGKTVKRANNVFYVVLRHGHLMLYDDIQQLEVRYVIALEYHQVDLYNGGDFIPEGELWIKRNAIRLTRKQEYVTYNKKSLPFFLFGENMSEKEDFYFALLKNQEKKGNNPPPEPQLFDVRHIVSLVQKLHSSEEHLQTRWLNAMMGRLFLAMYKTPELEGFIRKKLTKKISRVKKPNLITRIALEKIDLGEGAPFITNPRLKDLTVNGDCTVEADLLYTGNFRIEIAATARIDLGSRFKAREVELVLAVTCKRLEGHALLRFKPAPSNRLWYAFEKMPKIDLTIEPIVSSRQITYNIILKAIESRIREVIAETIVLPFWDDSSFLDTSSEHFRGGIWKRAVSIPSSTEIESEDPEDEAEAGGEESKTPDLGMAKDERMMSMPALSGPRNTLKSRTGKKSVISLSESLATSTSSDRSSPLEPPRALRSRSFASVADPMLTANHADANATPRQEDASAILKDLSARPLTASPTESPVGSPPAESAMATAMKGRASSNASENSAENIQGVPAGQGSSTSSALGTPNQSSFPPTPTSGSFDSKTPSLNEEPRQPKTFASAARSFTAADRKQALASISAATAAAQKWSWGVLNKNKQKEGQPEAPRETLAVPTTPIGRGRPLPPPGIPLPPPERSGVNAMRFSLPKRKPLPPPLLPKRPEVQSGNAETTPQPSPRPPLPERRRRQSSMQTAGDHPDEVLVVEAPAESAPNSPMQEEHSEHHDEFFGHGEIHEATSPPTEDNTSTGPPPDEMLSRDIGVDADPQLPQSIQPPEN